MKLTALLIALVGLVAAAPLIPPFDSALGGIVPDP
jgi:hypothetical protein